MIFAGHNQAQWQERQERFAKAAFPKLEELADDVERFAARMVALPFHYDQMDNADFMTLSFVAKQREHFQSVRVLLSHGRDRDALLIARTMIEGMAALLWTHQFGLTNTAGAKLKNGIYSWLFPIGECYRKSKTKAWLFPTTSGNMSNN